jgi:hypothetical protein
MDPCIEENSSDNELSLPDERHAFLDEPTQIDGDLHNNDTHLKASPQKNRSFPRWSLK